MNSNLFHNIPEGKAEADERVARHLQLSNSRETPDENVKHTTNADTFIVHEKEALLAALREHGLVIVPAAPLCYGVLLMDGSIDYSAPWPGACHEHINDMLMNDEAHEQYIGARVIPVHTPMAVGK